MRLHICLRSEGHDSIGPKLVAAQSIPRANLIWQGRSSVSGSLVQSKKPTSWEPVGNVSTLLAADAPRTHSLLKESYLSDDISSFRSIKGDVLLSGV